MKINNYLYLFLTIVFLFCFNAKMFALEDISKVVIDYDNPVGISVTIRDQHYGPVVVSGRTKVLGASFVQYTGETKTCDFRYAAENAKFGQPEVGLGITPGFGGTQRLPRVVGRGYGKEMIFRANMIDAQEAHRIGLVNKVVPQEELMDTCKKVAKEIMGNAPIAVQLAKTAINRGINCDVVTGIAYEDEVFALCFSTADQKEGMDAFVNKRAKHFQGK